MQPHMDTEREKRKVTGKSLELEKHEIPVLFFKIFNICLFGCAGLSCCTQDSHCIMQDLSSMHTDSLAVARGLSCSTA